MVIYPFGNADVLAEYVGLIDAGVETVVDGRFMFIRLF
jgi:hypothetical protein